MQYVDPHPNKVCITAM